MTSGFKPFNVGAALAICASLAFIGLEIHAQKPSVTRYNFSVVLPHDAPGTNDDTAVLPSPHGHGSAAPNPHRGVPRDEDDDDDDGVPLDPPGANNPIPT